MRIVKKVTMTDVRMLIIDALDAMRKKSIADKEPFRARAYQTVITQLKGMASFTEEDLPLLQGAGDKIRLKIKEIIETGALASAEKAKQDYNMNALDTFQQIYGVGAVKSKQLIERGITTIQQLHDALRIDPTLLNDKQWIGLQYYYDLLERIPYEEMKDHEHVLMDTLGEINRCATGSVVGSFRRSAASSGDIDFLVRGAVNLDEMIAVLKRRGYLLEVLANGKMKCMAICNLPHQRPRRLDILLTPDNEYAYALLYFTGSQQFNINFRQYALARGYSLNEHGLTPISGGPQAPLMRSERDIFLFLRLSYVEPRHRVDGKQILPLD